MQLSLGYFKIEKNLLHLSQIGPQADFHFLRFTFLEKLIFLD